MDVGLLDETDGYAFEGKLEVGSQMVGLRDADWAELYGGATLEGGTLSSFNGIQIQPGLPGPAEGDTQIRGYGVIDGKVDFDDSVVWADADNGGITFPGIVTGNPNLLRNVFLTGLNRMGASPVYTVVSGGISGTTERVLYGPDPWSFDPDSGEGVGGGFDAYGAAGEVALGGDLRILLDDPAGYTPGAGHRFAIFESLDFPDLGYKGIFTGWFKTLDMPKEMADWFWTFTYEDGSSSDGLDPLGDFKTATLRGRFSTPALTAVPEPGTLVLLISGTLGLLLAVWRRKRS